jgi:hypothetical protein
MAVDGASSRISAGPVESISVSSRTQSASYLSSAVSDPPAKRGRTRRNRTPGDRPGERGPDSPGISVETESGNDSLRGLRPDAHLVRNAAQVLEEVFREFADLRREGRNKAWTDLEDKVSRNASVLVSSGLITAKDMVGMLIDIEQFRKADTAGGEMPGDQIAEWLSAHVPLEETEPIQ